MKRASRGVRAKRIVISGYYGFDNAGDEAILQATIQGIRRRLSDAEIVVLSADPQEWTRRTGVRCVARYSPSEVWSLLREPGLFLSGGGGLFQDTTSRRSLYYYLGLLDLSRRLGMKTMVYAQGLGPLRRASSRTAVRSVLKRVDRITFRDQDSAQLLADIGLPGVAAVTSDPAFALEPAPADRVEEILACEGAPANMPRLAVAVRPWSGFSETRQQAMAAALIRARDRHGLHLLFVSMHRSEDRGASLHLASLVGGNCTVLKGDYTPSELAGLLGSSVGLVAMRLHAMILAANAGVPCLALSYDPKVKAMAGKLAAAATLNVGEITADNAEEGVAAVLVAGQEHRRAVEAAAARERKLAEENFAMITQLCTEG
ncbi:MAG: polysaccharide pyruvyl transferase CsaB [Chloroflexi bacterium]|nr:polysaccharide pyruvyl transferase CsaB [Chloroflexota bacterium]